MLYVALGVHLAFFPLGRRWQRHHAKHPRADAFADGLDGAALAGTVATFEDDADFQALGHHPLLQFDQLDVQGLERLLVLLAREAFVVALLFLLLSHAPIPGLWTGGV
ncbi:hypothetical protein D3C84_913930 [compost metagenome]